jgi:5'-methylthioadenosine phosphorylase
MADPFDKDLRSLIISTAGSIDLKIHEKGTIITIEGPRFSTRAESNLFRMWGADIINMSIAPEVILANELKIPYATIAMSTDYDCWKPDEKPVTWEEVLRVFKANVRNVLHLLQEVISGLNS